ncbi:hypothetical protein FGG08_005036 [Glutinoglossum americanum]|uniref:Uncharacterized protein n=1 Tax=Glutinoglossum americanum TaxID=1670608 RepID=A0A9P8I3V7_9PEZI|nr:hypothetical protein FGG08_005036 [Glutinoglossum americanum]
MNLLSSPRSLLPPDAELDCSKYKCWKITGLLPWASIIFIGGFAMREVGAYHYNDLGIYIASVVLLLAAPPVYAAADYFILGRTLYYIPYLSPIHPGRVVSTFIGVDVIIEILTGNGAAKLANSSLSPTSIRIGRDMIRASLILQVILFFCFVILAAQFHRQCHKAGVVTPKIRTIMVVLYVSSVLILVRSIYRTVEFFEGYTGYIYRTEPFFWVFEASLMFINSVVLNIWHPARYLPRSNKCYLSRDGVTERMGPGWVDKRPFIVTVLDPFDIAGLIKGRDKETAFWDLPEQQQEASQGDAPKPEHAPV